MIIFEWMLGKIGVCLSDFIGGDILPMFLCPGCDCVENNYFREKSKGRSLQDTINPLECDFIRLPCV